jgi:AcrR family transcriptional regulator
VRATAEIALEGDVTVARIVARAGVGRSTFYEFFDAPEHALAHLEQRVMNGLEQAFAAALSSAHTPLDRLRALLRAFIAALEARPLEARVVLLRRKEPEHSSVVGRALHAALTRLAQAAERDDVALLAARDEVALLAATAIAEAVARRHLNGPPLPDATRSLTELVTKILR